MNIQNKEKDLIDKLNPIIKKLYNDLLKNKPENILIFIKKFIEDKQKSNINNIMLKVDNEESYDSFSENNDVVFELDDLKKGKDDLISKKKVSVSAEVFGKYNKVSDFKPRFIKKNDKVKERILNKLNQAFMFSNLDEKEKDIVVGAIDELKFKKGDYVIKQGDNGDVLYIVEEGNLDCFKKFKKDDKEDTYLKTYFPGESFGELALLYNVPRAASIIAKTDSILYALDRSTFNNIVKISAIKKRELFEEFLSSVEILKSLNKGELMKLCDCLKIKKYKKGNYIIKEGEDGNSFFILKEGILKALKSIEGKDQIVFEYNDKSYFGELSLLKQSPRAASIIVCSDEAEILELDRFAFDNLLGPLEKLLERNSEMYAKFIPKDFNKEK